MDSPVGKTLETHLQCPISHDVMRDPVTDLFRTHLREEPTATVCDARSEVTDDQTALSGRVSSRRTSNKLRSEGTV